MSSEGVRLDLTRSGGFAGILLRSTVDTNDLPPEEAEPLEELVERIDFSALPAPGERRAGGVDRYQYDLTVTRGGGTQEVSVGETELTPDLRQLVDELVARELARRRRRG